MRELLLFLVMCFPILLWAQTNQAITGNVVDNESGEPVSYASVALFQTGKEQPITGTFTNEDGIFLVENIDNGTYDLLIQFVGYENHRIEDIKITSTTNELNVGAIKLLQASTQLEEVIVEAVEVKRPVETSLEGMTINPEQNLSNIGGSVVDILRNTPSIAVDQDGGITIRGSSSTNVLINGRNSALSEGLDGIPASAIESIEVVNNPGARYDAQGTGGVLNIKLKQGDESTLGTNGRVELTLGNRYRVNSSLNLNYQSKRFNVFGGYSYRRSPSIGTAINERTVMGENPQRLTQNRDIERNDNSHTVNYGFDYFLYKNKFSYEGVLESEDESNQEVMYTNIFDLDDNTVISNVRNNLETEEDFTLDNSFIYERLFDQKNREFRALISHSLRDDLEQQNTTTRSIDSEVEPLLQRVNADQTRQNLILQADYTQTFEKSKMEIGYKSTFRKLDNDYVFDNFINETEEWVMNTGVSNRFLYQEQVHALYGIYKHSFEKLEVSLGTRLEQTLIDTRLYNTGEENDQQYINPFPSIQGLYSITDNQSLKLTYSRRIDRPGSRSLNPFPDISDTLNIRMGNPNLQPEFIQSMEFGHKINFTNSDLTTTAFYRHTNGKVDWILTVDEQGISTRMPTNLLSGTDYGVEFIGTSTLSSWWDMNGSVSVFRSIIDGSNLNQGYTNDNYAWNAKLVSNMVLPWDLSFQMTGNYESPEVEAQGFDYARYYLDMSFQRKLFGDKASISLSIRDIFNTYEFGGENSTDEFESKFLYKRDTRRAYLSFQYNF
ncbi:TonB-dependent receptor domain-containing protein [Catalinimonas niigatensis]|uniref:TonB-dependent receptor domain-containing protein n=1 Tax=Catalinimonas niigatensis TaxID=1397264 RepID=UPI0026651B01|nr:TonB-dependent receptor [Catalinimonas niigatensis]WPP51159.1 TonB-dependent receptor [Catalinimonas niigatensis]